MSPSNDNIYKRSIPKIGDCGLRTEDTGIDLWLSRQYEGGIPNDLLRVISVQTWERIQTLQHGHICLIKRAQFLRDIGLKDADLVSLLARYGWVFLSHHGERG